MSSVITHSPWLLSISSFVPVLTRLLWNLHQSKPVRFLFKVVAKVPNGTEPKCRKILCQTTENMLILSCHIKQLQTIRQEKGQINMRKYKARIADEILQKRLLGKGAVLIEGPKWCGKTTTAEQIASSILYMSDPEREKQNLAMAEINPGRLLNGKTPRLIDEWQIAPKLWDAVRFEVDHRDEMG